MQTDPGRVSMDLPAGPLENLGILLRRARRGVADRTELVRLIELAVERGLCDIGLDVLEAHRGTFPNEEALRLELLLAGGRKAEALRNSVPPPREYSTHPGRRKRSLPFSVEPTTRVARAMAREQDEVRRFTERVEAVAALREPGDTPREPTRREETGADMYIRGANPPTGSGSRPQGSEGMAKGAVSGLTMQVIEAAVEVLKGVDGYVGCCLVDSDTGISLRSDHHAGNLSEAAAWAAGNCEVYRAKRRAMRAVGMKDLLEEMTMTTASQYHLLRSIQARPTLFIYLVLDRARANLGMARYKLTEIDRSFTPPPTPDEK